MKLTVIFEDFAATINKLKEFGISKLSQQEKDEIDADYHNWLKTNKHRHNFPIHFNKYLKELGLEVKENIQKFGTDEEKEFLKESFVRDAKIKAREFLERLTGASDWKLRAKTWGDPFGYGGHVVVKVEGFPWKKYGVFVRELKNLAKKAGFSFDFDADVTSYDSATGEEGEAWFAEGMGTREKA